MLADVGCKDSLTELVEEIVDSYHGLETIERIDQSPLPSLPAIIEILRDLRELIFPGFQQRRRLHWANISYHVGDLIDSLHDRLIDQIARALKCQPDSAGGSPLDLGSRSNETTIAFLRSFPHLRRLIATDVQAAFDGDPAAVNADEIVCCYPGLEAISIYRLAHELRSLGIPLIPRMMTEWAHSRTGIDIHPGARIGPGFFIDHGTGVVIGETCEIADRVTLYQGVTLGALNFEKDADGNLVRGTKRHPTIQRKVVVYANATILGGATVVGANSIIGAGVALSKSVAPNTVVTVEKPSLRFREAS